MNILSSILESDLASVAGRSKDIDCLVIGSGTAGVTTALRLADEGHRVVLLEAGPYVLPSHIGSLPFRSREEIVPRIHEKVLYRTSWITPEAWAGRDRDPVPDNNNAWSLVGGRTVFWGGCTPRFADWDFDDWPIDAADLAPFYDQAERLIHVSGSVHSDHPAFFQSRSQDGLIDRLNGAGIVARRASLGVDTEPVRNGHISRGFDSAVARLFRSGLLVPFEAEQPGVSLVAEAEALHLHAEDGRIAAVDVLDRRTGDTHRLAPRHVVLAGGAIQSARLALASGLDAGHPAMGHYINDHLFVQGVIRLAEPLDSGPVYIFLSPTAEQPFHVQIQGPFQETWYSPYHATVWLDCDPDGLYLLFYVFGVASVERDNRMVLRDPGLDRAADGRMRDYAVLYERSAHDRSVLERMKSVMPRVAEVMGGTVERTQENPPGAALHEIGGLRMGTDPEDSITDTFGRFWRYSNLSAADASIWPSQGSANSYLTITALALRNAEALLPTLGGAPG